MFVNITFDLNYDVFDAITGSIESSAKRAVYQSMDDVIYKYSYNVRIADRELDTALELDITGA